MRIGALCMLCMSSYVVYYTRCAKKEVIRAQGLCCVSTIWFKVYNIVRGVARALPWGGGASSFKGCRATSPPRKFNILYRVSEIQKNKGSPFWKFEQEEFTRPSS